MESIENDCHSSPLEFLSQLEVHKRLHKLYETRKLCPCILSFYLKVMEDYCLKIMAYMGSLMVPEK